MKDIEVYKAKYKIKYICIYTTYMHTQYTTPMTNQIKYNNKKTLNIDSVQNAKCVYVCSANEMCVYVCSVNNEMCEVQMNKIQLKMLISTQRV